MLDENMLSVVTLSVVAPLRRSFVLKDHENIVKKLVNSSLGTSRSVCY